MKRTLLFFGLLTSAAYGQDCAEIFISEYVEGSGNDKALELYNPTGGSINLSGYSIARFSNGAGTSTAGGTLNLSGSIASGDAFVIVNGQTTTTGDSPAASPALQAMADQLDGVYPAPTYMNGNDAIVLYKNGTMIDVFGKTGDATMSNSDGWSDEFPYDGSAGTIWTENHTLIRKPTVLHGITTNPSLFIVTTEYDSLPENTWSNLGAHTCNCVLSIKENAAASFVVYPNPNSTGMFNVSSSANIAVIEIIDQLGRVAASETYTGIKHTTIQVADLRQGVYSMRIIYDDNTFSYSNISIQ